jgi:putative ABC transport system substrate-binding protein
VIAVLAVLFIPQAKARIMTICVFKTQDIPPYNSAVKGFVEELKEKGYREYKDYILIQYDMKADPEEGKVIAGAIKEQAPDLILALGNEAAIIAKDNITDIPIVFSVVRDPLGNGLVDSMQHSGNNLTGSSVDISDLLQLEILRAILPNAQAIGVIYDPQKSKEKVDQASRAAERLGMRIVREPVENYKQVPEAVRDLVNRIDAMWLLPDTTVVTKQSLEYIFVRTIWSKKTVMGFNPYIVKSGALFSLDFDAYDVGRQSGEAAVRILRGYKPSNIPVTTPRTTRLVINLKMAKKLNVEIPEAILKQAKEIVE